ncbi:hypothetical protein CEXT_253881 [Caerostris extrusa]|uniref:Uncharacterized protein n=1 Tax=Caerostris extrusa TaxID=172846 RepID=A0AAV4XC95_CAEEX|nr:hypothetical protein CEXT_253881 [Caerostris extrusa]
MPTLQEQLRQIALKKPRSSPADCWKHRKRLRNCDQLLFQKRRGTCSNTTTSARTQLANTSASDLIRPFYRAIIYVSFRLLDELTRDLCSPSPNFQVYLTYPQVRLMLLVKLVFYDVIQNY